MLLARARVSPHRRLHAFCLCFLAVAMPNYAWAAKADLAVGMQGVGENPLAVGGDALVQLGVSEMLALRGQVGARVADGHTSSTGSIALVWALDVLSWVPELSLGAGIRASPDVKGEAQITLGVRRYLDFDWSLTLSAGYGVPTEGAGFGVVALGLWRRVR